MYLPLSSHLHLHPHPHRNRSRSHSVFVLCVTGFLSLSRFSRKSMSMLRYSHLYFRTHTTTNSSFVRFSQSHSLFAAGSSSIGISHGPHSAAAVLTPTGLSHPLFPFYGSGSPNPPTSESRLVASYDAITTLCSLSSAFTCSVFTQYYTTSLSAHPAAALLSFSFFVFLPHIVYSSFPTSLSYVRV